MSELTPEQWLDIHGLADGQLSSEAIQQTKNLIHENAVAAAEYESIVQLRSMLKTQCSPVSDEEVWKTCRARLRNIDQAKKAETFVSKYAWGLCAIFLVAIVSAGLLNRRNGASTLYTGDVASIASGLVPIGLPASKEPATVQQYVQEKTGGAPIDLRHGQLELISVLQGIPNGRTVTMFNFQDSVGPLSLIVIPNTKDVEGMSESQADRTYLHGMIGRCYCVSWVDDGFALFLLSQSGSRSTNDLQSIASSIRIR